MSTLATEKAFGKCVYFTLDHIFAPLFTVNTSLLTFKSMSHTVFLEFSPLAQYSGNTGSLKSVKIFSYDSKVIFYT